MSDKTIKIAYFNTCLNPILGTSFDAFPIYRSKGLLTHLINRKHFIGAKYIDKIPDIISAPDYIGIKDNCLELVKIYNNNIFLSIKLDSKNKKYYIATMFDIKQSKLESYIKSGRLKKT